MQDILLLDLTIDVNDNPTNYEVEIEVSPTNTESVAGQEVEFSVTIYNKGNIYNYSLFINNMLFKK